MSGVSNSREFAVVGSCKQFPCSNCRTECLSELLGTYLLVLVGPASIILGTMFLGFQSLGTLAFVAFCFGGTVIVLILILGKYSGAIINPALTVAAEAAGLLKKKGLALPFILFQTLGGLLAGLSLRLVFGSVDPGTSLGSTKLASVLSPIVGVALEMVGTLILAFASLASTCVKTRENQAILVGTTLSILILLIGPYTGAGFNPARSLGPSLASGYFDNLYIYLVGPTVGALATGLLFRRLRKR